MDQGGVLFYTNAGAAATEDRIFAMRHCEARKARRSNLHPLAQAEEIASLRSQ
jgi:hypothetical protein